MAEVAGSKVRRPRRAPAAVAETATALPGPDNRAVTHRLATLAQRYPEYVSVRTVLETAEARPIEAVTITDATADDADKQRVLIVAGQHGNEETARLVALKLMDYLLTPDARPILRKQKIVIMPNVSPDAAVRDTYETPAGIKPNLDQGPSGPVSPEATALRTIAEELMPEVYVDMHARGHAGCSHDMVLFPPSKPYTEDEHLLHEIAGAMAAEGERSGIPHVVHPLTWPGWGGSDLDQPSSTLYLYRRFKSLVFLTENAEHNTFAYPEKMRATSGVNRLKPLLALGNRRNPHCHYSGYPVTPAVGMYHAGVVAVGQTAAERRTSRIAIWRASAGFAKLSIAIPEKPLLKTMQVDYRGQAIATGVGFQVRVAGRVLLRSVSVNGKKLKAAEVGGYYTWQDKHTTYAVAALPSLKPGEHEITFTFQ
jgi:hypothetical protein